MAPGRRQLEAELRRERARPRRDRREIERLAAGVEAAEREIFLPRHPLEQHRALMHRRNSGRQRSARRARLQRRIVEERFAAIGRERARQHVHQRGLARAVLADQRVNLAGTRLEIDAVERERAAEALGYGDWRGATSAAFTP